MSENPPNNSSSIRPEPGKTESGRGMPRWVWILALLALTAGCYFLWLRMTPSVETKTGSGKLKGGLIRVTTRMAHKGDMPIYLDALGSVVPLNTVTVRTRVDGQLMEVKFQEGQMVQQGDSLVQIDPRPFQVQLEQAQGQLSHDEAVLKNAQIDLQRYQTLWQQDSIPKQTLDTQEATLKQTEGTVATDQAQIDSAKLNLTYCNITAPISGRAGLRLVDNGNIVHASDTTGLVVITQLQPINVVFTLAEDSLAPVLKKISSGEKLEVEILDRDRKQRLAEGIVASADNQIDPSTGTLKFKALLPNNDSVLFPNQFVNVRLLVETKVQIVLAPVQAIQRGAQNNYVYVLNSDDTVKQRIVSVGASDAQYAEIVSGLQEGEVVVVDGVDKLQDGSHVSAQTGPEAKTNE